MQTFWQRCQGRRRIRRSFWYMLVWPKYDRDGGWIGAANEAAKLLTAVWVTLVSLSEDTWGYILLFIWSQDRVFISRNLGTFQAVSVSRTFLCFVFVLTKTCYFSWEVGPSPFMIADGDQKGISSLTAEFWTWNNENRGIDRASHYKS